jgi:hypothetical protein
VDGGIAAGPAVAVVSTFGETCNALCPEKNPIAEFGASVKAIDPETSLTNRLSSFSSTLARESGDNVTIEPSWKRIFAGVTPARILSPASTGQEGTPAVATLTPRSTKSEELLTLPTGEAANADTATTNGIRTMLFTRDLRLKS